MSKEGKCRVRQRQLLHWAQSSHCAGCGRPSGLGKQGPRGRATYPTFDHVIAKSWGGRRVLVNGLLKHRPCNDRRADRMRLCLASARAREAGLSPGGGALGIGRAREGELRHRPQGSRQPTPAFAHKRHFWNRLGSTACHSKQPLRTVPSGRDARATGVQLEDADEAEGSSQPKLQRLDR